MSDGRGSIVCMENALPVLTGINTAWLFLLTYWTTSKFTEQNARIARLEAENKTLKRERIKEKKKHALEIKSIIATLKLHDRRWSELNSKSQTHSKSSKKGVEPELSSSSSAEESESGSTSDSNEDLSSIYDVVPPKKKR